MSAVAPAPRHDASGIRVGGRLRLPCWYRMLCALRRLAGLCVAAEIWRRDDRFGIRGCSMKCALVAACLLCLSVTAIAGQPDPFSAGMTAYEARDFATAFAEFRLAAGRGDAKAQFALGIMYAHGQGAPQDDAEAAKWIRLSAQRGFAPAQFLFGLMTELGDGVRGNLAAGAGWIRIAAQHGYAPAQFQLGLMHSETGQGVEHSTAKAIKWYRLAAQQGYSSAQLQLGSAYYNGQGVPQSYIEAGVWWAKTFASVVRIIFIHVHHEASAWWAAQHRRGN